MTNQTITAADQWTDWQSAGLGKYVTAHISGAFTGQIAVECKYDGVTSVVAQVNSPYVHTLGTPSTSDGFPADAIFEFRAGVPEGADWSGEASVLIEVGE